MDIYKGLQAYGPLACDFSGSSSCSLFGLVLHVLLLRHIKHCMWPCTDDLHGAACMRHVCSGERGGVSECLQNGCHALLRE